MTPQNIILRPAQISDLSLLQYWHQQPHAIYAHPSNDWNWETELQLNPKWREHLIAEIDGIPIGFIEIIDPALDESHYWGNVSDGLRAIDIWIGEESNLGRGYGTEMMRLAINRCFNDKTVTTILIDPLASNIKAHRFYKRLGFEFLREQRFGEDYCFVYQLFAKDWQEKRLFSSLTSIRDRMGFA